MPTGECRTLETRETPYSGQVLLPKGAVLGGSVPDRYEAGDQISTIAGQPPIRHELESFWIDVAEVTRGSYEACVQAGGCSPAMCSDTDPGAAALQKAVEHYQSKRLPQTCVSRRQAESFCAHYGQRLPTDIEFTYAARGPEFRRYPWGHEIRDELLGGLTPVGPRVDSSYFGVLGLATNGSEWISGSYDLDAGLRPFLPKGFDLRGNDNPFAIRLKKLAVAAPRTELGQFYSARVGHPLAARVEGLQQGPAEPLDRSAFAEPSASLGFRCAGDRGEEDPSYEIPALGPPPVPIIVRSAELGLFAGVAEGLRQSEAAAYCEALVVEGREDWRLPTRSEVHANAANFRGPGPFWASDGAIAQVLVGEGAKDGLEWESRDEGPKTPLLARCVRSL